MSRLRVDAGDGVYAEPVPLAQAGRPEVGHERQVEVALLQVRLAVAGHPVGPAGERLLELEGRLDPHGQLLLEGLEVEGEERAVHPLGVPVLVLADDRPEAHVGRQLLLQVLDLPVVGLAPPDELLAPVDRVGLLAEADQQRGQRGRLLEVVLRLVLVVL
eukprot:scaffold263680_cov40-Prasinocladus_malaysianus.AAC.1